MASKASLKTDPRKGLTEPARLNARVFERLEKALASDPEVDLISLFPSSYPERIAKRKKTAIADDDSVHAMVKNKMMSTSTSPSAGTDTPFFMAMARLIQDGEIIGTGPLPSIRMVVHCGNDIIAKLVEGPDDSTDYTALQYLQKHKPSVPVPIPHGLLHMGRVSVSLMSRLPGVTLGAVWANLAADEKLSVRDQLDIMLRDLRTLQLPPGMPPGGVGGEGCKDQRRHLRRSTVPIFDVEGFEAFHPSGARFGSTIFIDFLRSFSPRDPHRIVFTHGDLRPDNIMVEFTEHNRCVIVGLIDWEDGGFYPEYYEAKKITNCLGTDEGSDWYRFLPSCVSPHSYRTHWVLDYVWGRLVE